MDYKKTDVKYGIVRDTWDENSLHQFFSRSGRLFLNRSSIKLTKKAVVCIIMYLFWSERFSEMFNMETDKEF